jgi:hypothetical protein
MHYSDEEVRQQLASVKAALDAALDSEDRGPRRALLAALHESVSRSVGISERLASEQLSVA